MVKQKNTIETINNIIIIVIIIIFVGVIFYDYGFRVGSEIEVNAKLLNWGTSINGKNCNGFFEYEISNNIIKTQTFNITKQENSCDLIYKWMEKRLNKDYIYNNRFNLECFGNQKLNINIQELQKKIKW